MSASMVVPIEDASAPAQPAASFQQRPVWWSSASYRWGSACSTSFAPGALEPPDSFALGSDSQQRRSKGHSDSGMRITTWNVSVVWAQGKNELADGGAGVSPTVEMSTEGAIWAKLRSDLAGTERELSAARGGRATAQLFPPQRA